MAGNVYIQHMYYPGPTEDAEAVLEALRLQDRFVGGRVLEAGPGKELRVQSFYSTEMDILPDNLDLANGYRYVLIPDSLKYLIDP